jgi:hypothetical protein
MWLDELHWEGCILLLNLCYQIKNLNHTDNKYHKPDSKLNNHKLVLDSHVSEYFVHTLNSALYVY